MMGGLTSSRRQISHMTGKYAEDKTIEVQYNTDLSRKEQRSQFHLTLNLSPVEFLQYRNELKNYPYPTFPVYLQFNFLAKSPPFRSKGLRSRPKQLRLFRRKTCFEAYFIFSYLNSKAWKKYAEKVQEVTTALCVDLPQVFELCFQKSCFAL